MNNIPIYKSKYRPIIYEAYNLSLNPTIPAQLSGGKNSQKAIRREYIYIFIFYKNQNRQYIKQDHIRSFLILER